MERTTAVEEETEAATTAPAIAHAASRTQSAIMMRVASGRAPAPKAVFVISGQLGSTVARGRVRALIVAFAVAISVSGGCQ